MGKKCIIARISLANDIGCCFSYLFVSLDVTWFDKDVLARFLLAFRFKYCSFWEKNNEMFFWINLFSDY